MSEEQGHGIILRIHPYSETSLVVHWLTLEQGRVGTLIKGARRPQSPIQGRVDLFFAGRLSYLRSSRSTLHTLKEFVPELRHEGVRSDYEKLVQACYGVGLVERATESETPIPEVFALFLQWLDQLERHPFMPRMVFALEVRLLETLGLDPSQSDQLPEETRTLLQQLAASDWSDLHHLHATGPAVRQLSEFLKRALVDSFGSIPATRLEAIGKGPRKGSS